MCTELCARQEAGNEMMDEAQSSPQVYGLGFLSPYWIRVMAPKSSAATPANLSSTQAGAGLPVIAYTSPRCPFFFLHPFSFASFLPSLCRVAGDGSPNQSSLKEKRIY